MSNRPSSARGRRSEKEGANSETVISRHDVKSCEFNSSRPRIQQNDKSPVPSRGGRWHTGDRADSSTSTRFSLGKPKERDDASFSRRRSTDKPGGFGGKGGRRIDSSGHGGQSRNGSDPPSSNVTHGGGKLFISREFVTTGDMKSSSDGSGGKPFMDDSRLSKLVRRACREDDRERRLLAIHQLRDYLLQPENAKGIVKVADSLLVSLQDMFYERTYKEVKQEAAQCIGILGSTMGPDAQRYLQWLFAKLTAAPTDEAKILFLRALLQTLEYDDNKRSLADFMPMITSNTQGVLENADLPELLVAVVDIIQHIVARYPQVFNSHFRDTVDILVGWHIDATQKEALTSYTSDALVSFHQFWLADIHFSLTLLGQFLEDMEAYAEDLGLGLSGQTMKEEEVPTPEECITKIAALLRVYGTVVRSLGEFFTPEKQAQFSWEYIIENLERIVKCVDSTVNKLFSENVLTAANNCLLLLVGNLGDGTAKLRESTLLSFVVRQTHMQRSFSNKHLGSLLTLTHRLIELLTTNLPVVFITDLLGPKSLLHRLRFGHSKEMLAGLMGVYHIIMGIKNVPLLEEAYRHVLGDLEVAYNMLLRHAASDYRCLLVPTGNNPFCDMDYDIESAEAAIVFDVCALAEIGNAKNNLIGMWALSPSIFDLLAHRLLPSKPSVLVQYPAVQFVFLQILYSHCSRHGHFISSSNLITQNTILEGSLLANVSPSTGAHFSTVLQLLRDLLGSNVTPYDSSCLALKWVQEITVALVNLQRIYKAQEFHALVSALISLGYSDESDISVQACHCLVSILKSTNNCHTVVIVKQCVELCWARLSETNARVREAFISLMCLLPTTILTGSSNTSLVKSEAKKTSVDVADHMDNYWLARHCHMIRMPAATFQSHHFRSVMAFLLHDIAPSKLVSDVWLERIFYSCQRNDKDTTRQSSAGQLSRMIGSNAALQWFWATWEAAQFCVLAKLRTPLGKPQDTFTMIEAVLKKYSAEGAGKDGDDVKTKPGSGETQDGQNVDWEDVYSRLLRPCALLQFMEYLEKLLYNAYEGYAVAMLSPPKVVRTFFRTNRNTCQEWLTRVRQCIITIATHCGQTALVVWHTFELLRDMEEMGNVQGTEFEHVVMQAVQALSHLHCPEAILGLYAWCRDVAGNKMTWVKAAAEVASGRDEVGVMEFKGALKNYIVAPDSNIEELRDTANSRSQSGSPVGSPKHADTVQKFSILSKHQTYGAATTGSNGTTVGDGPDPVIAGFMVRQICESYMQLDDWQDVLDWQDTLQQYRSEHTGSALHRAFAAPYDMNYIKALSSFDEHDFETVHDHLELVPGMSVSDIGDSEPQPSVRWDMQDVVVTATKQFVRAITLCQTASDWRAEIDNITECLEESVHWSESVLRCGALQWPQTLDATAQMTLNMSEACRRQLTSQKHECWLVAPCVDGKLDATEQEVGTLTRALHMLKLQAHLHTSLSLDNASVVDEITRHISDLRLATARIARRQHNLHLAEKLLVEEVCSNVSAQSEDEGSTSITSVCAALSRVYTSNSAIERMKLLRIEREVAKLLHARGQHRDAIETLSTSIVNEANGVTGTSKETVALCQELNTRSLLSLIQWLQVDHKNLSVLASQLKVIGQGDEVGVTAVARNLKLLLEMEESGAQAQKGLVLQDADSEHGVMYLRIGENPVLSESDAVIGRLLHLGSMNCPTLGKSWFTLAGWCYKWGRKAVDNATQGSIEFSSDEKELIHELLPKGTSSEDTDAVFKILSQLHTAVGNDEDITDQDQSLYDDGTETARRQLLSGCLSLQVASDDCVDRLLSVWQAAVRRLYSYYQLSAKAYFTYVKLSAQGVEDLTAMDGNITATLRILRLLVKHAWELRGVLEDGLAHTPTAPWKGIIPQLFSRLNHPEPYVRQSVSELLCRVAHDAPHLIVYPAVVGCSSNKVLLKDSLEDALLNDYLSQNEDEKLDPEHSTQQEMRSPGAEEEMEMAEDSNNAVLQNCFTAIVDTLAHTNPQMIADVQLLVSELRRITLLWDELWLGTLNQHHQDVTRRLTQLDNEIKKVMNNSSLSSETKNILIAQKHSVLLKPTVFTMERLYDITRQPPETEHEKWFQKTYGKAIEDALQCLKNPTNPSRPQTSWLPFKQLHHSLQQRAQKRSSLVLSMEQISSKLANLKSSVIAMPGLSSEGQMVNIDSIHNVVQILPTKTKPKKLVFIGSDGNKYTYLFKGLEDLHLDERIMQFLTIVNNMFAKANRNEQRRYHARHYSVTPLGVRSGLIQWVDGATPLFSLYKRWQQREAVAQQQKHQQQGASSQAVPNNPPAIPRPSEVYYSKLTPALKEKGVSNQDARKEWPLGVMRGVLEELMDDTPKDLLARELWGSSTSATEWWQITQRYARSTAVMSMIGYIIGLGDRHLDNVLVDLTTGEVVHIDYNVCFEKGKGLRVPEKVPFRMTQNIEMAFGVTGVEGVFRTSCEHIIKTMRKGRETLLTLLEAFVYDPLVDWTTGNEGGYTGAFCGGGIEAVRNIEGRQSKKGMERDITLNMFAIRIAEMKSAWISNKEDMLASLPALKENVQCHVAAQDELHVAGMHVEQLQQQVAYLEEALTDSQHALFTLPHRYSEYSLVKRSRLEVLQAVQEKLSECEQWHTAYKVALSAVQGNKLQKMCGQVSRPLSLATSSFDPVVDFLQSAGQGQMVIQCEQATTEMEGVMHQRRAVLRSCLDVLHTYATIVSQYPLNYVENCRTSRWQHWLQEHITDFTCSRCKLTVSEYEEVYGVMSRHVQSQVQTVLATEIKLQSNITDINDRLMKLVERRNMDATDTSALTLYAQESTSALHQFVKDEGVGGAVCMTNVAVTALCSLAHRYIVMESAAAAAGDRLMDLTSRDGDWFLDELCSMSANVNQMMALIADPAMCQLASDEFRQQVVLAMQTTHTVYLSLQDLNVNFRNIILPETLKCLSSENPSVLAILTALDSILDDVCGAGGADSLLATLEGQLCAAVGGAGGAGGAGMEPLHKEAVARVKQLRLRFDKLLQGAPLSLQSADMSSDLTAGQMLLMGFNGLFLQLEADFTAMLEAVTKLRVTDQWMTAVDVLAEASVLQVLALTDHTRTTLSQLFFLKQLTSVRQFFHMCQDSIQHKGPVSGPCYDDDHLARPVRHFIAEYVRKHMIGLPSQTLGIILCHYVGALNIDISAEINSLSAEMPDGDTDCKVSLEDLCKKALELGQSRGTFDHAHLTQASSLIATFDLHWRKLDLARRLDSNAVLLRSSLHRAQLDLARYQWLNEDVFTKAGCPLLQMAMPARATVMSELRKGVQSLVSHETAVLTVQERHLTLETSITQRLKWAAGANPSLSATLQQFEETLAANTAILQTEALLATDAVTLCNAILHFEALRTRTPEAISADASFLLLINRCDECCQLVETCSSSVTELEESMMVNKLVPSGEKITSELIQTMLAYIGEQITDVNGSLGKLKAACVATKDGVRAQVGNIRGILTTHHKLMSDVRSILKSMAKQEEQDHGSEPLPGSICEYVNTYKSFSENFTAVLKQVMSDDITASVFAEIDSMTGVLCEQIIRIYDELVKFAPPLVVDDQQGPLSFTAVLKKSVDVVGSLHAVSPKKMSSGSVQRLDLQSATPASLVSPQTAPVNLSTPVVKKQEKVTRDPRTGKAIQERNSYAVGVWKRIKMKLDGRDPDVNRRLSVAEQVDYVIKEATDLDNLAVLYEGWTPWV